MNGPVSRDSIGVFGRSLVDGSKTAFAAHREVARGSVYPHPRTARPTFFHGFMLPLSLMVATLRERHLGLAYLKLICARAGAVLVVALLAFGTSDGPKAVKTGLTMSADDGDRERAEAIKDAALAKLGLTDTVVDELAEAKIAEAAQAAETPPPAPPKAVAFAQNTWLWVAWFIGVLSLVEALVAAVTRRWDDWLAFHVSWLARIRPEDPEPKAPSLDVFDARWLWKKYKRRVRGYAVVGVGIPFFLLFQLVPVIGGVLTSLGITIWSWYWLTVFAASKSGHAWIDDGRAPPPLLLREVETRMPPVWCFAPARLYARFWLWVTRGVNAPASMVERSFPAFAGLALARVVLALPGLYLLARPIIPVAAGRLCAETDPHDRFSLPPAPSLAEPAPLARAA